MSLVHLVSGYKTRVLFKVDDVHIDKTVNFVVQYSIFLKFFAALLEIFRQLGNIGSFSLRAFSWKE